LFGKSSLRGEKEDSRRWGQKLFSWLTFFLFFYYILYVFSFFIIIV